MQVYCALCTVLTVDSTEKQQEVLCASDLLKMVNAPDMDINAGLPVYCALHSGAKRPYQHKEAIREAVHIKHKSSLLVISKFSLTGDFVLRVLADCR